MRRQLPVLVERHLGEIRSERNRAAGAILHGEMEKGRLSCVPGCAHCCSYPVLISIFEGILLYQHLAKTGRWTPHLKANVVAHSKLVEGLALPIWFLSGIECPLLTAKNRCTGYEARPFFCRAVSSHSDPESCLPNKLGQDQVHEGMEGHMDSFHVFENQRLREYGILFRTLSLSQALLYAERIVAGSLDLEKFNFAVALEAP